MMSNLSGNMVSASGVVAIIRKRAAYFMGRLLPACLGMALMVGAGLAQAANVVLGEKIFVPMFQPNPELDGYAVGLVEEIHADGTLTIKINQVVTGKGKTLAGTCHPSGGTPLAGAQILSDDSERLVIKQRLDAEQVMPYRRGSQLYLERENLSIAYLKYLSSGMGITPDRLDVAIRRAREVGLPDMVTAMQVAKLQVVSTQGNGFPVPASRALQQAAPMLDQVAAILESHPQAVEEAARMLGGTTPGSRESPLAAVIVRLHDILEEQLGQFEQQSPDPREVSGYDVDDLLAIYNGWYRVMTGNDSRPFQNAHVSHYSERAVQALNHGEWPSLL